jgi:DNA-directed RNA polymerase omega subunit
MSLVEEAMKKVGNRFKLAVLMQKRVRELQRGAPRLVQSDARDPIEVVLQEIIQEKITLVEPDERKRQF